MISDARYPAALTLADLRRNLAAVETRIAAACRQVGRDPAGVRLLPVSKTVDAARLRLAHGAGCRELGENKVQEAWGKAQALADLDDLRWVVVGHLQGNKAGLVARFASEFQALDSLRLAETLERRLQAEGRGLDVFVQVNTSGEESKSGINPDDAEKLCGEIVTLGNLSLEGLMTIGPLSDDEKRIRESFILLAGLRNTIQTQRGITLPELSMGMSGDYEIAISEGATLVRIGSAMFGNRTYAQ